jgi:hypothetical protein
MRFIDNLIKYNNQNNSTYVDLAPTDKADPSGVYSDALMYAIQNPDVMNIALTGPYGSGKSSIIKTFLGRYKKSVLQISLASFLPEALDEPKKGSSGSNVSKQEIERSILQQLLYGADANSLPFSRFKRIHSPMWWSCIASLLITIGVASCWYLLMRREEILDGSFFKPLDFSNWLNFSCIVAGFLFIWFLLHTLYIKSYGVSLKSISLKDIEIAPKAANEESILNRHLDEIIYFFQSTNYELVVIEDLDRFNNTDIFVTLREINSLINANAGVKRQIRFLYALRDNMFKSTDRTKFFEFIIPVIPIINSSNSIDKIIEQGKRLSLSDDLNPQFLREVSRYLNDLRLIQNIFNEYAIYVKNLETDKENNLDSNKLLAVLIYKNVLPSDFEELHRGKGNLANILGRHNELISKAEKKYKLQISELEQSISNAEKQLPSNLEELRKIYAASLIAKIPQNYTQLQISGKWHPIQSIWSHQNFEALLEEKQIFCLSPQQGSTTLSLNNLQAEVNKDKTYQERKKEVECKSDEFKESALKTIKELRSKTSSLRSTKFKEIIRTDITGLEEDTEALGESGELVKFLILEGYLDDTYYQYTSLFHSGRLSPNDNKFLIRIRAFNNPEPDFQIDNPKEVIAAMRGSDFRQNFVLNTILVDCLLSHPSKYHQENTKLLEFISSKFEECDAFFQNYYENGKKVPELLSNLIEAWPNFISAVLESSDSANHVAMLLAQLPEDRLEALDGKSSDISDFISINLDKVLALEIDFDPERLRMLSFEMQNLTTMEPYSAIKWLLTDEGLYELSIENIEFIFSDVLDLPSKNKLTSSHYTTILNSGNETLISKVEDDFEHYLNNILLALDGNSEEDVAAIVKALNHDEIESESLEAFLRKQSAKLPSLENVPLRFHEPIFRLQKIEASWDNCLVFVNSESFNAETLTDFLSDDDIKATLCSMAMEEDDSGSSLRQFLIENNNMEEDIYQTYVQMLPRQFKQFPGNLDSEKLLILIEEGKITFSVTAFSHLHQHTDYQVRFIAKNIDAYFNAKDQFEIDDNFREKLLNSDIDDSQKLKIIEDMDLGLIAASPSRASVIGQIFYRTDKLIGSLGAEVAQAIIVNSETIEAQISLFNKFQSTLSDNQIWSIIHSLPKPFSEIKPGYRMPTIPNNQENLEFAEWLQDRSIISSWKFTYSEREIRIHPFRG